MMYNIGEKPGKGSHCCATCGGRIRLDDDDRLPPAHVAEKGPTTVVKL
jgi:hypothetical protein